MTHCQPVRSSVQDMAPISQRQTPVLASPIGQAQTATLVKPEDYCSPAGKEMKIATAHHPFACVLVVCMVCQIPFSGDLIDMRMKYGFEPLCEMGLCMRVCCICILFMLVIN